ncbi:radical SAM protein with 4Fe4S-binding SPASM domain [Pedobacter sp. AK017]|uniref:radical SAM protein n=1 Tax=Pedobacter sp. AK017 TaxID=2723073 RepID=UPI001615CA10|nr:radical SAM protein [Pedobacter sp. AK017]MBB5441244.1 radical SAM protein with 4Fe4S-binding SPASM domain [Pedobacter sp. AK017]
MELNSTVRFDRESFDRLQKRIKDLSVTRRERIYNPTYAATIPYEVDVQLTYACNLRCKMCYQWNDDGYFHSYNKEIQNKEIDVALFKQILDETRPAKSRLYLWGGEPLYHTRWAQIADLIEKDPRHTVVCTNGILLEKNMESLLKISPSLALLVSIDGLDDVNDELRGKKTFERLIKQVNTVLDEQRKGNYKGTVSVNVVLNDALIPNLYEFVEYFEALGINSIYFNYPWFISPERAKLMDEFYAENFAFLGNKPTSELASWHSYSFKLSEESDTVLQEQIVKLNSRTWKLRVRFQQQLESAEILDFISDRYEPKKKCFALSNRIEVLADGKVGTCSKFFPELSIGNLNEQGLVEIWQSDNFKQLRGILSKGLMPVCAKCILLYRNGI